jgi:uncharacterized delta-60 repeat protein
MRTSSYKFVTGKPAWFAAGRRQSAGRSPRSFRPHLEVLERRALLSAGDLDSSFGTGGEVQTSFPPNTTAGASAVAIQPDGKIVVAGSASGVALARYNPDGSLDPGFGTGGRVTTSGATGSGIALQTDGKIVVAGTGPSPTPFVRSQLFVLRYLPDGSLDSGFGSGGEATLDDAGGSNVVIQPDGKIVVAGTGSSFNLTGGLHETVARFNPDGSRDQGFGTNGLIENFGITESGLALQGDGKLVIFSTGLGSPGEITRFNPDGSVDSLFGTTGHAAVVDLTGGGMGLQTDGRIVVVGANGAGFGVDRVNSNGTIDATFGTGGSVITDFGPGTQGTAFGVAFQSDGRIIVVGNEAPNASTNFSFGLIRYTPNGSPDTTFGTNGRVTTMFGVSPAQATAVALQSDGKIVAVGSVLIDPSSHDTDFGVARYLGDMPIADGNQRFLTHVYLDLLGRLPDSGGLATWTGLLNQGDSRTQVVQMIEASSEYQTVEVEFLYGYVLGRAADPTGLTAWGNFLAAGGTFEQLEANLLGSDEYFSGRGGGSNESFLQAVYRDVLSRTLDPSGDQTWRQALSAGVSRTAVGAAILASKESDTDEVQALYVKILRRSADSSGLNLFTNDLQQGVPNEAVLAALAGSDEYFARP